MGSLTIGQFADGSSMTMDNRLRKYESLSKSLLSLSSRVLLAKKRRDLAAGRAEFGPVILHPDGVQVKGDKKSWEELEQAPVSVDSPPPVRTQVGTALGCAWSSRSRLRQLSRSRAGRTNGRSRRHHARKPR